MYQATLIAVLAASSGLAIAQAQRDPADPLLPVPPVAHESAFTDYQSFREQKPAAWRDIHEEIGNAAGHAGHAASVASKPSEAQRPPAPAATAENVQAPQSAAIVATGVIQEIDRANAKVKLTHEPISALGWPQMTMYFRLKDAGLADQVKAGDKVEFALEKAASGYVISGFRQSQ